MIKKLLLLMLAASFTFSTEARKKEVELTFFETSDVHGSYFTYDFINRTPAPGGLARICTYVREQREKLGKENVILVDNGDILQGQPAAYYYNFIDTTSTHLCASILNYMEYDAAAVGNHDVETGHAVYDRWVKDCHFPVLGANVIDLKTNQPYWQPYTIVERQGLRIAILGMITPGIPTWLPNKLWSGLRFDDQVKVARQWMPVLRNQEKADIVIGVFHSGLGKMENHSDLAENAATQVANQVPGFDLIFYGHDHRKNCLKVANTEGDSVLLVNPGAAAVNLAAAKMKVTVEGKKSNRKVTVNQVEGEVIDMSDLTPDPDFCKTFAKEEKAVRDFTEKIIGHSKNTLDTRSAFFGSSAFVDFIHSLQLKIGKADISFAAPLSFDAEIPAGDIRVSDMFNLYKYENFLYVVEMSGKEIQDYLEFSYGIWAQQMKSADDHVLLFSKKNMNAAENWQRLENSSYNFDSAAGLLYTVDVTKPAGQRVTIHSLANGEPFTLDRTYRVAVNSYRGNGGGKHFTQGAGIPKDQLSKRIVWSTDKDLRYYLMKEIEQLRDVNPQALNQWKFVPEDWVKAAQKRDAEILFR